MGILEKLRPQPRWKHADPGVRAAAVYELGPDEGDALRLLAREDTEARVRRAAVTRLSDIAVLGDIGRTDPDEDVRAEAIRGLAGLAAEADEVDRAADAVRHQIALGRFKEVVIAARENPDPQIRSVVVDLIEDPKSLGAISRHAQDGATRLRALGRLHDAEEILNVAIKSEHTDVAVSALDRVEGSEPLSAIAQRGRNKVAARRARMKMRQLEEAAQPHPEVAVPMSAEDRERALSLLHRAEALVTTADPDEATAALAEVRLAWAELQADVETDAPLAQRFDAACEAVREAIEVRRQERAAEHERAAAIAREQADRVAIVTEIEQLSGPDSLDRIAELRVRWDGLPPMPSEYAASLTRRFQDASRTFEDRERRRVLAEAAAGRLETLATELEQLLASDQPVEEVVARWRGLRRDADVLREHAPANVSAAERLERAVAALEEKELQYQHARAKVEQDNLRRLQQVCRQVETLATTEQVTLKAGDRALREIRTAMEERVPLPSKKDRQEILTRLEAARAALAPRVQELRDADEWQRWANLQVQEEICKEMEALKAEANLDVAGRRMRELQARWKPVALAPRAQGEVMWRRFKTAQDEVFARTSAHFAAQNEERISNLARKQTLCEKAEALADSTDWVKTATEIQSLQAEWKSIGPVARGHEKAIWERFRAACDRFFTRRQEDLKRRKEEWSSNLARKEAVQAAASRVEDDRPGAQVALGSDLAAVPRCVRSVLRSLQASRSSRTADQGRRARHGDSRTRDVGPGGGCAGESGARESLHHRPASALAVAAGAGASARPSAGSRRAISPGRRPAGGDMARCVCGHRSRPRDDAQADGEAAGACRGDRLGAARGEARESLADGTARPTAARASRGEHDGGRQPRCRKRGITLARE
jgi:hypothetical protein